MIPAMIKRKKPFNIWHLRYRLYAILVMIIVSSLFFGNASTTVPETNAIGYNIIQENILAKQIERQRIIPSSVATIGASRPDDVDKVLVQGTKIIYLDKAGQEITDILNQNGYNLGFISSIPFVELNLPLQTTQTPGFQAITVPETQPEPDLPIPLDKIVACPGNPQIANFLRYPKYNVSAPIVYTSLEDLFNLNPDGTVNFQSPRDGGDTESPVQIKLRDGIVHLGFTPQPGEIGNSYIVGHSSNYAWIKSAYNSVFKPLEKRTQPGEEFFIYDRCGRELKFRVIDAMAINKDDVEEAYRNYPDRRIVTLQTSILVLVPGQGFLPEERWITRGELVTD